MEYIFGTILLIQTFIIISQRATINFLTKSTKAKDLKIEDLKPKFNDPHKMF